MVSNPKNLASDLFKLIVYKIKVMNLMKHNKTIKGHQGLVKLRNGEYYTIDIKHLPHFKVNLQSKKQWMINEVLHSWGIYYES